MNAGHKCDHIFKEDESGLQFVGDFEGLYAEDADPWGQSGTDERLRHYYHHSRNVLMDVLEGYYPGKARGLEVGCGLGYLTRKLNLRPGWDITGMDVSETAIEKATSRNPGMRFKVGDITKQAPVGQYDFIILAQCWWYVLHAVDAVINHCVSGLKRNGLLVISQAFLREQKYGNDIAEGIDGALRIIGRDNRLQLVAFRYDDSKTLIHHDGLLAYRVRG